VTRVVAAEVLKLRTTRTFWALAGATFGLILLIVVLSLSIDDALRSDEDTVRSLITTAALSGLLMFVFGAVAGAGEYRHGTIGSTLLVTPDRLRAVAAKTIAGALGGFAVGIAASAVTAAVALPWLSAIDAPLPDSGELARILLGNVLYSGLAAALGVALGLLVRNQVATIVTLLLLIFAVDPAISALADDYARFSLSGLSSAMSGGTSDDFGADLLPFGAAAAVWAGYTVALAMAAAALTARRDI
jgi:ABC-type transport system involved in multi-copper enzyme maturation permease subunit